MSETLRMADGDLFIEDDTGRAEIVTGPTKVSQELADLFLDKLDLVRNWGSELTVTDFSPVSSPQATRDLLLFRVNDSLDRMVAKQEADTNLDLLNEKIKEFSRVEVLLDTVNQSVSFVVVAEVGDKLVQATITKNFKPVSLNHVIPPPPQIVKNLI